MSKPFVAILMGSDSDLPVLQSTMVVLNNLEVPFEAKITSAHRTPDVTHAYVKDADARGCVVFICAAGLAAHLAGAVAGLTLKPVIGIPLDAGPLQGMDSLFSTVQMPGGIPVATVAVGKPGAKNAAYLAAQIMSLVDPALAGRVKADREANAESVKAKDALLQAELKG
jgi:5-(carboxyamino)imidazole ribonucleotide mutase